MSYEKQKIVMLKGLPASGKSTWRKEEIKNNKNVRHWNNDEARDGWDSFTKEREKKLSEQRITVICCFLTQGHSVIIDDTNLNPIHEQTYRKIAEEYGIEFEIKEFLASVVDCIRRDAEREGSVGKRVIMDMSRKWKWNPQPPAEFDAISQDDTLRGAVIVDIDGTIAKMGDRSPFDYTKVHLDSSHRDIINLIHQISRINDYKIIVVSGRMDNCEAETRKWMKDSGFDFDELHMRKSGDMRKDSYVKYEILENKIQPNYYVHYVFDDRDQVVKMWREAGLRCLQVANGAF